MNTPPILDCEQVIRLMFAYLDGDLGEADHQYVAEHLEQCRSCFSRAEFEQRLKAHLAGLGKVPVPTELEARVRSLIGQFRCA